MSGHSKWATIKHKKAAKDERRGKEFAKLIRFIEVAARSGGSDPAMNPTLATAVQKARDASVPKENIERAIKRGAGELEGVSYTEVTYEGYAPGGVAVLVSVLTDNRNRAAADVRSCFTKNGGNLGEPGSVAWKFEKKGVVLVPADGADEDQLMEVALEAGAEDVVAGDDSFEIHTAPSDLTDVRAALEGASVTIDSADITMLPQSVVPVDGATAPKVLKLIDRLEDLDDVQDVYADFDIPDDVLAQLG
jgi:YebC/PmpR family DNA-binding regulatory protein